MRRLVLVLALAAVAAGGVACGATDYQASSDRRGEVNARSFELVSTRADGDEWSFRARGNSLWVGFVRDDEIGELGETELGGKEAERLWELIEQVDVGGRKRGKADDRRGTVTMRLREPDGSGGHDLRTVFVSRKTKDADVLDLLDFLTELVTRHHQVEPSL